MTNIYNIFVKLPNDIILNIYYLIIYYLIQKKKKKKSLQMVEHIKL